MSNKKFYIILNILNIFLLLYIAVGFYLFWYFIFSSLPMMDLFISSGYILYLVSKFVLLPLLFFIFGTLCEISIIKDFIEELKNNEQRRKTSIKNAILYDLLAIIILICIKPSGILFYPFTYEVFTIGGIVLFYIILYARWDEVKLKEKGWI